MDPIQKTVRFYCSPHSFTEGPAYGVGRRTFLAKPLNPCSNCEGFKWNTDGYVPASGSGTNGVLVVAEAAGEHEEKEGIPLVGKSGYFLWNSLKRIGIDREGFKVHNVLSCRPPDNKLAKMPYEQDVISTCAPLLDATIAEMRETCKRNGRTFVILCLGKIAFKRIMGLLDYSPILREDYLNYPFWNERYGAWVIAADHPSYIQRGQHHLLPILQFGFQRALEIAEKGLTLENPPYILDPDPTAFDSWLNGYLQVAKDPEVYLSYDIETPYKVGKSEDAIDKEDEQDENAILRISFSYKPGDAVSIPWNSEYFHAIEKAFNGMVQGVGWNNSKFDDYKLEANGVRLQGKRIDGMLAWHVLNTSMPKGLGFVTPYYAQKVAMWKHLSGVDPVFYSAKDPDMALRCWLGIKQNLIENNLWSVFENHVIKVHEIFDYMSRQGVCLDTALRAEAELKVGEMLEVTEAKIENEVPDQLKDEQVYRKVPTGHFDGVSVRRTGVGTDVYCANCGLFRPAKNHFAKTKKKENPCHKAEVIEMPGIEYFRPLEWKISKKSLLGYQSALGHIAMRDREGSITFDENAILRLMKKYPKDPLYPLVLDQRGLQKLLSTNIGITQWDGTIKGGLPVGKDGKVHTTFTSNPSTLRSASQRPNLQNQPRPKGPDDPATLIRNLFVASPGHILWASDYSGIEAVLVGYSAAAPGYMRLALRDVHSFYTAYALHELDGRVGGNDLPLLSWDDDKLFSRLADIKKEFKYERNNLYKHLVHAINFGQGAPGAQEKILNETGITFPLATIKRVMDIYKRLFPEIPRWHQSTLLQVERDGFLRNAFGYIHRFTKPFDYEKVGGKWQKKQGSQANEIWAFQPQSNAAAIIKMAMSRIYFDRFEEAGQYLRLLIHDELWFDTPLDKLDKVAYTVTEEMRRPIPELRMPPSWKMGDYLSILTEAKMGPSWGRMK